MTVKDVIESGIVSEFDKVTIKKSVTGPLWRVRNAEMHTDAIMDESVYSMSWVSGYGWTFNLDREVAQ